MRFPLDLKAFLTPDDTDILARIDETTTQIPYDEHCGAFGVKRTHDVHTGVDLYAPHGTPVYAMQTGIVVDVFPFTGVAVNSPWWHDTAAVAVEDYNGIWLYGEITPDAEVQIGAVLQEGTLLGTVSRVLRNDKGRPLSMLHIERYRVGTRSFGGVWNLNDPQPVNLLDPTDWLMHFDHALMWYRKHGI